MSFEKIQKTLPSLLMLTGGLYGAIDENLGGVIMFSGSAALVGFQFFLERNRFSKLDALKKEIAELKSRVDSIAFGRTFNQ